MKIEENQLLVATIVELAVRTTSKVAINKTRRGFGDITPKMYDDATTLLRDELAIKGVTNV